VVLVFAPAAGFLMAVFFGAAADFFALLSVAFGASVSVPSSD
jgi:hypothetical protein